MYQRQSTPSSNFSYTALLNDQILLNLLLHLASFEKGPWLGCINPFSSSPPPQIVREEISPYAITLIYDAASLEMPNEHQLKKHFFFWLSLPVYATGISWLEDMEFCMTHPFMSRWERNQCFSFADSSFEMNGAEPNFRDWKSEGVSRTVLSYVKPNTLILYNAEGVVWPLEEQ